MRYLPLITSILFAASIALMAHYGYRFIWGSFANRAAIDAEKFERWSVDLFLGWDSKKSLRIAYAANAGLIVAPLLTWALSGTPIFAGAVAIVVYAIPGMLLRSARNKRLARIEKQMPDAINVMVSTTRAGRSLSQ